MKKKINKSRNLIILLAGTIILAIMVIFWSYQGNVSETKKVNTMLMLIEFEKIDGVVQWEKELDVRSLTALVKVQDNVLEENPEVFKELADKGYEIAGGYDEEAFWDMSYEEQYKYMEESKELVESITGKTMRVFGSRYFAYDETTLKVADELGIEYILGRGTQDVEAVIYQPEEYKVKIISVTNVDVGEPMGRGSLCDYSLWARGADPEEFGEILEESIAKNPENMIIVSHAYLGGTRLAWWEEYQKVLSSDKLEWNGFDDWLKNQEIITLPNAEIPINDEVNYTTPQPAMEMEEYEAIPGLENEESILDSSDGETYCL